MTHPADLAANCRAMYREQTRWLEGVWYRAVYEYFCLRNKAAAIGRVMMERIEPHVPDAEAIRRMEAKAKGDER